MKKTGTLYLAASLLMGSALSSADDTEIYLNGAATAGTPYLHLMLDYRPSVFNTLCTYGPGNSCESDMSTEAYTILGTYTGVGNGTRVSTFLGFVAVMQTVIENPLYDPIKLALISPNKTDGGTILKGYTLLGDPAPGGRQSVIDVLKLIPEATTGNQAHKLSPKETYFEWFRYINGGRVLNGKLTTGNFTAAGVPTPNYDASIINNAGGGTYGTYISPLSDPNECPKMYSIVMGMNTENQDDDWNREIEAEMSALAAARKFENMLTWLHRSDTDLVSGLFADPIALQKTWVISDGGSLGQTPDWARAGGSGAVLSLADPKALEEELENAFKEVISVSSTFVAASVPVNVFNQAKTLDNLFIALFEAQSTVRWPGNLKKLKLADTFDPADPNNPAARDGVFDEIVDVNGNPGFESTGDDRGRITFNAVTYWTDIATLPSGDGQAIPINADGREVARGGGGQKIDGFVNYGSTNYFIGDTNSDSPSGGYGPRQLFVEPATVTNGSRNTLDPFDADNTTVRSTGFKALLGDASMSDTVAKNIVKWGRGQDVAASSADARSWIMADAIHSRPFALNYGTAGGYSATNPNIRIMMGTGDGIFRIIENTDTAGNETGREVFGFYPRELLKNIAIRATDSRSALKMPYGVDGAPVVLTKDINKDGTLDYSAGDEAFVYFGLRRGGSSYYALDVSNPNDTRLLWKITRTSGGDFDELGLTFSTPVVGSVNYNGTSVDVLVFAGGYEGGWDPTYTNRVGKDLNDANNTLGNAIYIVNARTGALIWKAIQGTTGTSTNALYRHAGLVDSIPSDVAVLQNANGNIHRIYVGDTGGAVWRVDLPEGNSTDANFRRDNWFITKLAELGTDGSTTDRRFFHAPDLVETYDSSGDFDGILIESGDRAHPNDTSVSNYMFYIKDRLVYSGAAAVKNENTVTNPPGRYVFDSAQANGLADQTACVTGQEVSGSCNASLPNGWKIQMTRSGEKGLSTPLVDGGRVFFTTFRPPSGTVTCAPTEGQGSVYVVNLADGTAYANNQRIYEIGPGIPPGAILIGDVILLPGGGIDLHDLDGDGVRDQSKLPQSLAKKFFQIYWREPGIDKL